MAIVTAVLFAILVMLLLRLYSRLTLRVCYSQQDMTGKTVLITGASSGIGKATAFDLARRNARILLACRNRAKAEMVKSEIVAATGNTNVEVKILDLESFDSVRKCAKDVLRTEERLDVLINNAGDAAMNLQYTKDGCERLLQINHFGHFLLTLLLLDLLKKSQPSRIINVSSIMYLLGYLNIHDLVGSKESFLRHIGNYYCRSKLANILFTRELARRLNGTGVTANAAHPGIINTGLASHSNHPSLWFSCFIMALFGRSDEEGAQTTIYLAVAPEVEKTSGKFFYECREGVVFGQARSQVVARKLFQLSEDIVGETFPTNIEQCE